MSHLCEAWNSSSRFQSILSFPGLANDEPPAVIVALQVDSGQAVFGGVLQRILFAAIIPAAETVAHP